MTPIRIIHQTDLFRPRADPDDHFDLLTSYSLAVRQQHLLDLVLIDAPPSLDLLEEWPDADIRDHPQPDVIAVAQLNRLTGLRVPVVVGSSLAYTDEQQTIHDAGPSERQGITALLYTLEHSLEPVVIHIAGSCRDVAFALAERPDLFINCAGIYLNAGLGTPHVEPASDVEYNVSINRAAFAVVLAAPCPVFWLPCFQDTHGDRDGRQFSTWYEFDLLALLPRLSPFVQGYLSSMFLARAETNWMCPTIDTSDGVFPHWRNMWCTAGYLHACGLAVRVDGKIALAPEVADPLFSFRPVTVQCDAAGRTSWVDGWSGPGARVNLFAVNHPSRYIEAMGRALGALLTIPGFEVETPRP